ANNSPAAVIEALSTIESLSACSVPLLSPRAVLISLKNVPFSGFFVSLIFRVLPTAIQTLLARYTVRALGFFADTFISTAIRLLEFLLASWPMVPASFISRSIVMLIGADFGAQTSFQTNVYAPQMAANNKRQNCPHSLIVTAMPLVRSFSMFIPVSCFP